MRRARSRGRAWILVLLAASLVVTIIPLPNLVEPLRPNFVALTVLWLCLLSVRGTSLTLAWRAGRVMNYGDGIYGGMFVSCMYAAAFFESDPRRIVETGLACLPARSPYARLIADWCGLEGER